MTPHVLRFSQDEAMGPRCFSKFFQVSGKSSPKLSEKATHRVSDFLPFWISSRSFVSVPRCQWVWHGSRWLLMAPHVFTLGHHRSMGYFSKSSQVSGKSYMVYNYTKRQPIKFRPPVLPARSAHPFRLLVPTTLGPGAHGHFGLIWMINGSMVD